MKRKWFRLLSLALSAALLSAALPIAPAAAASDAEVVNLRTDYMEEPVGIDTEAPVFSWEMESAQRGILQTHYQIVVKKDSLEGDTVWDSRKVEDGRSVNIAYAGEPLESQTKYVWTVQVWDNLGGTAQSAPASFETGLYQPEDWGEAQWLKYSTEEEEVNPDADADYTYAADFQIIRDNFSLLFSGKDANNYFMWAINTNGADHPYLRRHVKVNGNYDVVNDIPLPAQFTKESLTGSEHRLSISVSGDRVTTTLDGVTVDTYTDGTGTLQLGDFGIRVHNESVRLDNVKAAVAADQGETLLIDTDFEDGDNPFAGGQIVDVEGNAKLLVDASSEMFVYQKSEAETPDVHYTYELDFQLTHDNMGLIFAAKDRNNYFMWAVNTNNADQPYLRRHIFVSNSAVYTEDINLPAQFTKDSLFDQEHHIAVAVEGQTVTTSIDGVIVDTYTDNTGNLCEGYYGFRFFNEGARVDNVRVTGSDGEIQLTAGFDDGVNPFDGGDIVEVEGDCKLSLESSQEYKVFENRISAATAFRKEFTAADKEIASARVYYSALGVSDLYINGQRVGRQTAEGMEYDELKPGWTDYDDTVFYLTYDVTDSITAGANAIGAEVASGWYNGVIAVRGGSFYSKQPNGLMIKLDITYADGSADTIVTDTTWQTSRDMAVTYADIYNGETYDARKDTIADWSTVGYDAAGWIPAREKTDFTGKVIGAIGSTVQTRPELSRTPESITVYSGIKDNGSTYGEIDNVENPTLPFTLKKGQTAIFDMGQNMVGWEQFTVKGDAGTAVNIEFGEMLNDSGEESRKNDGPKGSVYNANYLEAKASGQYVLRGDAEGETYNPRFTFYGFRYVQVTAAADVEILDLDGVVVGNANVETGSIETSDAAVNQLFSNIMWGMRDNFLSTATDCPQRNERLGWTADTHIFSRTATYNADTAGFYRKWLQDMRDSQFGPESGQLEGAYPDVAPNTHIVGGGNGGWAEAGIIVPWNVYLMYGDTQLLEEHFPSMEKFMDYLATRGDSEWKYNGGGAASGDWVSPELNDDSVKRYISVTYYAYSALLMEKMAAAIGNTEKEQEYGQLYEDIKAEFNERYVNTDGSLKVATQTTYLLALKLDLFRNSRQKEVALDILLDKIKNNGNRLSTGFIGTSILNQTLSDVGADDMAYTLLLQRDYPSWLFSVDQGATTIWENWDSYTIEKGFKDPGMNSFNHYAFGAVGEWMYRYMAGIEADEENPAFKHIILQPTLDKRAAADIPDNQKRMTAVTADYHSAYGQIASAWTADADGNLLTYDATVPANTTATLYLPIAEDQVDLVLESGTPVSEAEGVEFVEYADGAAVYFLGSGSYSFRLEGTVSGVTVTADGDTAAPGDTVQFTAQVTGEGEFDKAVTWSVAGGVSGTSIDENGLLTIAAEETAESLTITAASVVNPAVTGSMELPVQAAGELEVTAASPFLVAGKSVQFTAGDAEEVTWSVTGGVTGTAIDESGLLTVAAEETAENLTVTAASPAGTGSLTLPVSPLGDLNRDDVVDIQDVMAACKVLARQTAGTEPTAAEILSGDTTGEGNMAIDDVMGICRILANQARNR